MRLLRFYLRLLAAFVSRFKTLIILGIPSGFLIFFIINFFLYQNYLIKREKIGFTGKFTSETVPREILSLVSSGLTKLDESGKPVGDLANNWETSENGLAWTFELAPDKFWQDGKRITSQSLTYQFSDLAVSYPSENKIVFNLKDRYAAFPVLVSQPVFKKGLLGVGEWKVKSIKVSGNYFQELTLINSQKNQKTFKFYPTENRTLLAFKLGEVDQINYLSDANLFSKWPNVNVKSRVDTSKVIAVFFNTQDSRLSDKSLRQALAYAIDKVDLAQSRAISPISPTSWAFNPQVKPYDFDPTKAKKLIADLSKDSQTNLTIKLSFMPSLLNTAEKIAKNWQEVGVSTSLAVSADIPTEFQAFLAILDIPTDPDQYAIWHSTRETTNISHYNSPRIDKLLEDGRQELNFEDRKKIYLDFQRFLVEDSPAIFLYHPTFYQVSRK